MYDEFAHHFFLQIGEVSEDGFSFVQAPYERIQHLDLIFCKLSRLSRGQLQPALVCLTLQLSLNFLFFKFFENLATKFLCRLPWRLPVYGDCACFGCSSLRNDLLIPRSLVAATKEHRPCCKAQRIVGLHASDTKAGPSALEWLALQKQVQPFWDIRLIQASLLAHRFENLVIAA